MTTTDRPPGRGLPRFERLPGIGATGTGHVEPTVVANPVPDHMTFRLDDVTGGPLEGCGHVIPEEQPDRMLEALLPFLGRHSGPR
jgi:pimeloyl-ACP methyl ester carboxylesterase